MRIEKIEKKTIKSTKLKNWMILWGKNLTVSKLIKIRKNEKVEKLKKIEIDNILMKELILGKNNNFPENWCKSGKNEKLYKSSKK